MKVQCPSCGKQRIIKKRKGIESKIVICSSCAQKNRIDRDIGHKNGLKKCTICKEWKLLTDFPKSQNEWDGLNHYCKECNVKKFHKYYQENKERCRAINYKSIKLHCDKQKARMQSKYLYPERQLCSIKGCQEPGEKHHNNYDNPSDIVWVCKKHHRLFYH